MYATKSPKVVNAGEYTLDDFISEECDRDPAFKKHGMRAFRNALSETTW